MISERKSVMGLWCTSTAWLTRPGWVLDATALGCLGAFLDQLGRVALRDPGTEESHRTSWPMLSRHSSAGGPGD